MRLLVLIFCITLQFSAIAQRTYPIRFDTNYNWESSPDINALKKQATANDATILKDYRVAEYTINESVGRFEYYYTRHLVVYINSDKAIEQFNRVAIPLHDKLFIASIDARTISPDGRITKLSRETDYKEVLNYENLGPYLLFAFAAVETGSVIEYKYTFQKTFKLNGTELFSSKYPVLEAEFSLLQPKEHFGVTWKDYNSDFQELDAEAAKTDKRDHLRITSAVAGRPEESYAPGNAALTRIEYHLIPKADKLLTNDMLWEKKGKSIWENINNQERADIKACKKLAKKIIPENASPEEKIRAIESYLKKNIRYESRSNSDDADYPHKIIARKTASDLGLVRMYHNLSKQAGVKCMTVLTLSRYQKTFDPEFASFAYLHEFVLFFPELNSYISPSAYDMRYGFIPEDLICQQGLFIGEKSENHLFEYYIRPLVCQTWEKSLSNTDATVRFDLDAVRADVAFQQTYTGYSAINKQDYKLVISGEKDQQDYILNTLKYYSAKNEPKNIAVIGDKEEDLCRNPFIIKMDYSSEELIEKAGTKYIFHIGDLIGPQSQLYKDTLPRLSWVENEFNRGYVHKLVLEIPEGYKVSNPDAVNFDVKLGPDNDEITRFHSWYTIEGNRMIVEVKEMYGTIRHPKEYFEAFRKVINAAADFNKVVLYLEKK